MKLEFKILLENKYSPIKIKSTNKFNINKMINYYLKKVILSTLKLKKNTNIVKLSV